MTLTLARFPGSGSSPSMYMAKSSIPNDPPIIGIDRSDIVDGIPMNERPKAPPPPLLYTDDGGNRGPGDDPDVPGWVSVIGTVTAGASLAASAVWKWSVAATGTVRQRIQRSVWKNAPFLPSTRTAAGTMICC